MRAVDEAFNIDPTPESYTWYAYRDWLQVGVGDYNGCGIDPDAIRTGRGIGNMRKRAEALDAKLRVARANPGTQIDLDVPVFSSSP